MVVVMLRGRQAPQEPHTPAAPRATVTTHRAATAGAATPMVKVATRLVWGIARDQHHWLQQYRSRQGYHWCYWAPRASNYLTTLHQGPPHNQGCTTTAGAAAEGR